MICTYWMKELLVVHALSKTIGLVKGKKDDIDHDGPTGKKPTPTIGR